MDESSTAPTTATLGDIIDNRGLPTGATAVIWPETQIVETADQVADDGWQTTVTGTDYDRTDVGRLIYADVPEGAVAWKYADPTEGARWLTSDDNIARIRAEDPSLVVGIAEH